MEVHSNEKGTYRLSKARNNFQSSLKDVMQYESHCYENRFEESLMKGVYDRCTGELPRYNRITITIE